MTTGRKAQGAFGDFLSCRAIRTWIPPITTFDRAQQPGANRALFSLSPTPKRRRLAVYISPWTSETLSRLNSLWSEGSTSRQIAAELGVTRNAVLGQVFRMRAKAALALRPKPVKLHVARTRHRSGKRVSVKKREPDRWGILSNGEDMHLPESIGIAFLELRAHQCRAPLDRRGDDGLMLSCGACTCVVRGERGVEFRSPYCAVHHRLYHQIRRTR